MTASQNFTASNGERRNPLYEGCFDDETQAMSEARRHWATAAVEAERISLLDAHASALRDAERLRSILRGLVENEGAEAGVYLSRGIGTASASGKRWLAARAALDDNTKGAIDSARAAMGAKGAAE